MPKFCTFSISLFLLLLLANSSFAQKRLKLDINRWGGAVYFDIGDELQFQLKESKDWYHFKITDFNYKNQSLLFDDLELPLSRIKKLYVVRKKTKAASRNFGGMLLTFGATWTGYAVYGALVGSPAVGIGTFVVGAIALGAGGTLVFLKSLWKRHYKIGKKHRLRIVDWSMEKDMAVLDGQTFSPELSFSS